MTKMIILNIAISILENIIIHNVTILILLNIIIQNIGAICPKGFLENYMLTTKGGRPKKTVYLKTLSK